MDPTVTVDLINNAIADQNILLAHELMRDLDGWINKGGFVPAGYYDVTADLQGLEIMFDDLLNV